MAAEDHATDAVHERAPLGAGHQGSNLPRLGHSNLAGTRAGKEPCDAYPPSRFGSGMRQLMHDHTQCQNLERRIENTK